MLSTQFIWNFLVLLFHGSSKSRSTGTVSAISSSPWTVNIVIATRPHISHHPPFSCTTASCTEEVLVQVVLGVLHNPEAEVQLEKRYLTLYRRSSGALVENSQLPKDSRASKLSQLLTVLYYLNSSLWEWGVIQGILINLRNLNKPAVFLPKYFVNVFYLRERRACRRSPLRL